MSMDDMDYMEYPPRFGIPTAPPAARQPIASGAPDWLPAPYPAPSYAAPLYAAPVYVPPPLALAPVTTPAQAAAPSRPVIPPAPPLDRPRRGLVAAMIYNPAALIGYLIYLYGPADHCIAGPACGFVDYPPLLQGVMFLVVAGALWLLVNFIIRRTLEAPGWHGRIVRGVRAISEYRLLRPLLGVYGAAMLLALLGGLLYWRLTPAALIFGGVSAFVCLRCALWPELPAAAPMIATGTPETSGTPGSVPRIDPRRV
jgi:hypothetical protein